MGLSVSNGNEALDAVRKKRENADIVSLSALRSQFTSTATSTLDQATMTSARFRQEERLRADLRRERRIRQQAITERVNVMQDALASDLAVQHELTLDSLEKEMREEMERDLSTLERDSLAREESRMRGELELRLNRQLETLQDKLDVEQDLRLEEHKAQLKAQIETQLQDEHRQRLDIQKNA